MCDVFRALAGAVLPLAFVITTSGCTYERKGEPELHFSEFKSFPPRGNAVTVCHAYGCQMQTRVSIPQSKIAEIAELMKKTKRKDTPFEERRAVAYAVASIEQYTGDVVGTKADRPGMDYDGSGDPTQMDCVDKATNMTSYLLVLQNNKLLKFHTVSIPISKGDPMRGVAGWPHWTAILRETAARAFSVLIASERGSKSLFGRIFATQSGSHFAGKCSSQRYAVDSWAFVSGENPAVVEIEKWYIKDLEHLPPSQM